MANIEELEDILDQLVFEEEPSLLTDACVLDIIETALHLMEEYMSHHPTSMTDPAFRDILFEELQDMFSLQMEDHFVDNETLEEDIHEILEIAVDIYLSTFYSNITLATSPIDATHIDTPVDSDTEIEDAPIEDAPIEDTEIEVDNKNLPKEKERIASHIQHLKSLPQPVQRTPEWYQFRWNLITASNAWKAFGTQSAINQLIYEKCQPLKEFQLNLNASGENEVVMVNTNTTLHWGQKYEPLSVLMYEHLYQSKVEDFGCIQHPTYPFIGASPDGIITESSSGRYGRMLEIKNIVNREITGIPKQEYWVQMQLQMEVCDLDECDFLETKFTEYPDYRSYKEDSIKVQCNDMEFDSLTTSKDGSYKGIIMYFHTKEGKPHYEYMPLGIWKPEEVSEWEQQTLDTYENRENNPLLFIKFIYWKLEKISCILVKRNKDWFKSNVRQLEKIWKIIEQERITGYEHRAPVRKNRTYPSKYGSSSSSTSEEVCFLKVVKL